MKYKVMRKVFLECETGTKVAIELREWVSPTTGSTHEAWFRRGKMVSVDFIMNDILVTSGAGAGNKNSKRYFEV